MNVRFLHSLLRLGVVAVAMLSFGAQGATGQEATTVNVGVLNTITDIPLILADRKGFFSAEGIKVNFTAFASSSNMVVPLATGQLDVGGGGGGRRTL